MAESAISKTIDITEQEAQYDACVKRLLSQKIILAWILKECVREFKPYPISQIMECIDGEPSVAKTAVDADELDYIEDVSDKHIEGMNTEDKSIREGTVYYDIKFGAHTPDTEESVQLIINIEAQKDDRQKYPIIKRGVYYCGRMLSAQKNTVFTHSDYGKLRKVYSIWIQMNVDKSRANSITEYSLSENTIVGDVMEEKKNYDMMTIILMKLGNGEDMGDKSILRLLDVLLSAEKKPDEKKEILEKDFDIPMTAKLREEANVMCNLGEGLVEKAYAEGITNGELRGQARMVMQIMRKRNVSIDEVLDEFALSDDEREEIREIIDEQLAVK